MKTNKTVASPRNPIVLLHGLLGFDELHPFGNFVPGIQYWRGIVKALELNAVKVITASVPPSGSIESRAAKLSETIAKKAQGQRVNIIAYVAVKYFCNPMLIFYTDIAWYKLILHTRELGLLFE